MYRKYFLKLLYESVGELLALMFLFLFVYFFILSFGRVNGYSMESKFIDNDLILISKIEYLYRQPKRFEIVQFISRDDRLLVKRIIGLPNDVLVHEDNKIWILVDNTWHLAETKGMISVTKPIGYFHNRKKITVPPNSYYVLGDNRNNSNDSRNFGPIKREVIIGRVIDLKR